MNLSIVESSTGKVLSEGLGFHHLPRVGDVINSRTIGSLLKVVGIEFHEGPMCVEPYIVWVEKTEDRGHGMPSDRTKTVVVPMNCVVIDGQVYVPTTPQTNDVCKECDLVTKTDLDCCNCCFIFERKVFKSFCMKLLNSKS